MIKYKFYLRGGQVVEVVGVADIKMKRDLHTGRFIEYSIKWEPGYEPEFFSIVLSDISAVISEP